MVIAAPGEICSICNEAKMLPDARKERQEPECACNAPNFANGTSVLPSARFRCCTLGCTYEGNHNGACPVCENYSLIDTK